MSKRQRRRQQKQRRHAHLAPKKRQVALGAGVTIGATAAMGGVAHAGSFEVNSLADPGSGGCNATECTLREALYDANGDLSSDFITFASGLSGTINLGDNLPNIAFDDTYIYGPGAGVLAVDGGDSYSIISSSRTTGFEGSELLISGLTLANGSGFAGGAVSNVDSDLALIDSVVTGSGAFTGGGIANGYDGPNNFEGDLLVYNSTISNNSAKYGGGITSGGDATIFGSTITGNGADFGGGVYADNFGVYTGYFNIQNSTVSGNTADELGGGIYDGREPIYHASGVGHDHIGLLEIRSSTIANNQATFAGGGIYENDYNNNTPGGSYFIQGPYSYAPYAYNTIVGDNSAGAGPDMAGVLSAEFTLLENSTDSAVVSNGNNKLGADPQLYPLASNGGPTQTQELAPTSPAVDQGSSYATPEDQRGAPRPFDFATIANAADASDMGAFELQPGDIPPPAGAAAPKCKGKTATVFRSNGRTLTGTNKRDVIVGTKKKDRINSRGGNDLVCAKGGNDRVNGGGGKDKLFGQGGKDKLLGKGGKDKLVGGAKKDTLKGGGGADKLLGKGGNDTCVGGPGKDTEKSC
jgi:CSLREA domain-containing protein